MKYTLILILLSSLIYVGCNSEDDFDPEIYRDIVINNQIDFPEFCDSTMQIGVHGLFGSSPSNSSVGKFFTTSLHVGTNPTNIIYVTFYFLTELDLNFENMQSLLSNIEDVNTEVRAFEITFDTPSELFYNIKFEDPSSLTSLKLSQETNLAIDDFSILEERPSECHYSQGKAFLSFVLNGDLISESGNVIEVKNLRITADLEHF